jgi:uncharacterized delta-60 repeat protein
MAIQPDGKILLAGMTSQPGSASLFDVALVRYLADGSLDASFGAGGVVVSHVAEDGRGQAMVLQPDGKILVAGLAGSQYAGTGWDPLVARYHANGFLDPTFGVGGVVRLTLNGHQRATGVALTATGRIVLSVVGSEDDLLVRLRQDGELDDTFGAFGFVLVANPRPEAVAIQPDGKILVPGGVTGTWGCCGIGVARHHPTGALDTGFSGVGLADPGILGAGRDVAVQPNGKIVVAGSYGIGSLVYPFLWRVNSDGTTDSSFQLQIPQTFDPSAVTLTAVALQPDGKIVAASTTGDPGWAFRVMRYHGDPPDLLFRDGFESGALTAWSSSATGGGDLGVSLEAALDSTPFGLRGLVNDTAGLYVQDDTPDDESRYRARFHFDPNGFDPGEAEQHRRTRLFIAFAEDPMRRLAAVVLRRLEGSYSLMARVRQDDNTQVSTPFVPIDDGPHAIELDWRRASGPDALDGAFELWIDGVSVAMLAGLDNSDGVDLARLGALSVKTGAAGALHWDEFESRRESYIGP